MSYPLREGEEADDVILNTDKQEYRACTGQNDQCQVLRLMFYMIWCDMYLYVAAFYLRQNLLREN